MILSIDGGGIRGIIPALILSEIENKTNRSISDCFDLIAGTSTGAIIALGMVKQGVGKRAKFTASELAGLYSERGRDIFPRSLWKGFSSVAGLADEVYSYKGLEKVLDEYFGSEVLGEGLTKTIVTCYDIPKREPLFLKSWDTEHKNVLMKDAARATSAAPTYFEPAYVPVNGEMRALVDGGVFINSPAVSAFVEAKRIFPNEKNFTLVSLGTGEHTRKITYEEAKSWGKVGWILPLLSCMFDGSADATHYQMKMLLGEQYFRFQIELSFASDDMDNSTNGNIENLKLEASRIIDTRHEDLEKICQIILQKKQEK